MPKSRNTERTSVPNIVIHSFGGSRGGNSRALSPNAVEYVRATLQDRFRLRTLVGEALPYPADSWSESRGQYRSTEFIFDMDTRYSAGNDIHLGMTDVDLYVPELNFVFGEASASGRVAVFSTARLEPLGESDEDARRSLLAYRAATEAVHEIGHVLGLKHCQRPDCVMWFSNTLAETDRKGSHFCIDHQRELTNVLKALAPAQGRTSSGRDRDLTPDRERDLDPGP